MENNSQYLPKGRLAYSFNRLRTTFAYRVWKRKLARHGGFDGESRLKVLDAGCGAGHFLRSVERWYPESELHGLDIDKSLTEFAGEHVKKSRLITHDGHALPFADDYFDVVGSLHLIEHLERPEAFLTEAHRVLKPKGFLIIATPNPEGIPAKLHGSSWPGYRYDHISLKTPLEWRELIGRSGFQIVEDGTTVFTGIRILDIFPFALVNWIPLAVYGFFHWDRGASYMGICRKVKSGQV